MSMIVAINMMGYNKDDFLFTGFQLLFFIGTGIHKTGRVFIQETYGETVEKAILTNPVISQYFRF